MKKSLSRVSIILGCVSILCAAGLTVYNVWDESRAAQMSRIIVSQVIEEIENPVDEEVPLYVLDPQMDMPTVEIDGSKYLGILDMPTIGITLPINQTFTYDNLKISACRYRGSAYTDDLIVCAHNYRQHFGGIETLSVHDELTLTDVEGNVFFYEVKALEYIEETQVEQMIDTEYDLTLFTCTMDGQSRVTIRCNRIR